MKIRFIFLFFILILGLSAGDVRANVELIGRWVSTDIDRKETDSIGTGWAITFRADGSFTEEIDEGFGIVEVWDGTYTLEGNALSMHRTGFKLPWEFTIEQKNQRLIISRNWRGNVLYVVYFEKSDGQHPELSKLPRWPKSKAEAVAILKQKMKEKDLQELAATPKEDLIGKYHFGLGMYIRNAFGIWRGNKDLWEDLTQGKPTHPDDLSGIIIEALWEDIQDK
ncbi:MAG: lipocalin family protein [Deltaproteobacteria bacterium]|nr:lipocalin family protein [Deltaproteobacteria bacterium]